MSDISLSHEAEQKMQTENYHHNTNNSSHQSSLSSSYNTSADQLLYSLPVYLSQELSQQLYLIQSPLRPMVNKYTHKSTTLLKK